MTGYIKKRPIIAAVLVAILAMAPATVLAQTEETTTAPVLDVVVEVEMERRFNEFRSQYLDDRANSIGWWLGAIALVLGFFALLVPVLGYLGYRKFLTSVEDEARKSLDKIKGHEEQAGKTLEALRKITSEDMADPAKAKQVEKVVETVQQTPGASPIDKAIAMAHSLQKAGETEKAIEKWRAIGHLMEGVDNEFASRAIASVGYLLESPQDQISAYSEAIRLDSGNVIAYNNRGNAKVSIKQYEAAIKDYDEAIGLDPNLAIAYHNRSIAKGDLKQYKDAIKDSDQAILLAPKHAEAYSNRGDAKANLKQYESAIKDYDEAIRLNPKCASAYYNRSTVKIILKQYESAIKDCDEAIRLDPKQADVYNNRGGAKANLKQYEDAIKDYDEAIRLNPNDSAAYNNRGLVKGNVNRIEEARSDFQTALRLAKEQGNEELATDITSILRKMDNSEKN